MTDESTRPVTRVLRAAAAGDPDAARDLLPLVYDELRDLARARLRKLPPGQTLQATALVHEAYLRVVGREDPGWDGRGHFFGAAARAMRDILVDEARRKLAAKRGGDRQRVSLDRAEPWFQPPPDEILAIDEALARLEREDPRKGEIVNLRYFARLTAAETALALGISVATVGREWRYVRAWLERELRKGEEDERGRTDGKTHLAGLSDADEV
jgi:RNA polymerase sigma factor (TIGR02999 family)